MDYVIVLCMMARCYYIQFPLRHIVKLVSQIALEWYLYFTDAAIVESSSQLMEEMSVKHY